jgi:GT2 family glycosyltransferase
VACPSARVSEKRRALTRTSIVVPVHNRVALTRQCVDACLSTYGHSDEVEVIVVDDGSNDSTADLLSGYKGRLRVVSHAQSEGFAASCNDGAAEASGEYVLFLNNDTVGTRGWLEALVSYVEASERVAVVGSKLLYQNETVQHAGIVISQDLLPRHVYRGFPAGHPAVSRSRRFQAVTGACMLVRRSVFEGLSGFDGAFQNGFEDVDLCLRVAELDYEVHFCRDSVLFHLEAATRAEDSDLHRRNVEVYLARWRDKIRPDEVAYYFEDGLLEIVAGDLYPLKLRLSPLLGAVDSDDLTRRACALLGDRARQSFELLKENTALRARLGDASIAEGTAFQTPETAHGGSG